MKIYIIHCSYADNYKNHQMIKEIFPGDGKLLFQRSGSRLVVATDLAIDIKFSDSFGIEFLTETQDILGSISGDIPFAIRLNAVKGNKGKRFPVYSQDLSKWVDGKLSSIGANIRSRVVIDEGVLMSDRRGMLCSHASVLVTGYLEVTDPEVFESVVHMGIGHGKAFGFGFLNVFR